MPIYTIPTDLITLPSAIGGELLTFDATGASVIVAAGSNGDILSVVAGVPAFISGLAATQVTYDNTTSGLTATDVQAAIDEVEARLDTAETNITNLQNALANLTFLDLTDTPANYTSQALRALRVNSAEDGVEFSNTSALFVDSGSTAQRPGSPANGMIRYNTDNNEFEGYIAGSWQPIGTGGGGGGVAITSQTYLRTVDYDGTTDDTLTLPATQTDEAYVFVFADGVWENSTSWALITGGTEIQFDAIIPNFIDEIEIRVAEDVSLIGDPDQNLWATVNADVGTTTADTTTDTLTITGGTNVTTTIVGDTLTIDAAGGAGDPDQNLWETIVSDSGSTTADTTTDSLTITGGTNVTTSIVGDVLTIDAAGGGLDQNLWETITADAGSTTANTTTDNLSIVGGAGISTSILGDILTITAAGGGGATILDVKGFTVSGVGVFTPNVSASSAIIIAIGGGGGGSDGSGSATGGGNTLVGLEVIATGGGGATSTTGGTGNTPTLNTGLIGKSIFNLGARDGQNGQLAYNPGTGDGSFTHVETLGAPSALGRIGAGGNGTSTGANTDVGGGGGAGGVVIQVYEGSYQTYFGLPPYDITVGTGGSGGGGSPGNDGVVYIIEMA
jgi:hypothetical protein